ncbi:hypothetical protein Tco_0575843, partial [Tanacetum coccineum]
KVVEDVCKDEDFKRGSWVSAIEYVNANGGFSCTPNVIGNLTVTLKDLSVFSPKPSMYYLNIAMRNMVKFFHKDTVPGSGNSVGGSGMLDEEEIMKLIEEEEEIAELELQVCGNVTDQEDQYKLDEKH